MAAGRLRTAQIALAVTFVAFGAIDGTWAARLPALKERLGLDSGTLGLVIFLVTLTATLLLPVVGWLAARRGSRGPTALGLLFMCAGLTGAAFAPSLATLLPAACVIGAGFGIADVAANAHTASRTAVFLAGPVSASAAVAAAGVVVYALAMAFARLAGDRLLLRWGVGSLARRSGTLTCLGIALALSTRSTAPALVGFALVGAGCAAIVPALFRVAGSVPGVSSGAGIAAVATAGTRAQ